MTRFASFRLDYIDALLLNRGKVRRNYLTEAFGVSMPQASADIADFIRLYPRAMAYDKSAKCYIPARNPYKPVRGARVGDMVIRIPIATE